MDQKYWYLQRCDLFSQLTDEQMGWLERQSQIKTFQRGQLVYLPAEQSDCVLLVANGRIRIYSITAEGKEALLAFVDAGELFGELAVIGQEEREEFAEAMEKTELIKMPRQVMMQLMQQQPLLMMQMTRLMGLRRQIFERRLKSLLFQPNRERLIHLLLELAERYGMQHAEGIALKLKLSQQEMANLIGSTRETVTMVLRELQIQKLVIVKRRQVILRNIQALAAAVQQKPPNLPG